MASEEEVVETARIQTFDSGNQFAYSAAPEESNRYFTAAEDFSPGSFYYSSPGRGEGGFYAELTDDFSPGVSLKRGNQHGAGESKNITQELINTPVSAEKANEYAFRDPASSFVAEIDLKQPYNTKGSSEMEIFEPKKGKKGKNIT